MKHIALNRLLVAITIFLGTILANENGVFYFLNHKIAELHMALKSRPVSGQIALLEIDNKSLEAIGLWPWKRSIYGDIVRKSFEAGAQELAFDIDFSASSSPEEDAAFQKALEEAEGPVALAIFQQRSNSSNNATLQTNRPIKQLEMNAWMATVNVLADSDGMIRHFPMAQIIDGEAISSLAGILGGAQEILAGTFIVDYGINPATIPTYSVIDLLEGRLPSDALKGKKILLGAGAAELRDTMAVPVHGMLSGPKLQILASENILQNRYLSYSPQSWVYGLSLVLFVPIALITLVRIFNTQTKLALFTATAFLVEAYAFWHYSTSPIILPTGMLLSQIALMGMALLFFEIRFKDVLLSLSHRRNEHIEALLETIVEDSFSGILITTKNGEVLEISQQAQEILRSIGHEINKYDYISNKMPEELVTIVRSCLQNPKDFTENKQMRSLRIEYEGECRYFEYTITPSLISSGTEERQHDRWVATILFHDVTKAKREQIRLAYLADHDQVTGLFNEAGFFEEVDQAMIATLREDALVIACQPRRLSKISHSLGAEYADLLLQKIAKRLQENSQFDVLGCTVQREFLICVFGASIHDAGKLAQQLEQSLDRPFSVRGHSVIVGSHIGIADFHQGGVLAEEVTKAACVASHRNKEIGEDFTFYTSDLAADVLHRRVLEREIVDALKRNEFEMFYQPQACLKTGEILGCEALIRWNHRDLGIIRPDLFIPIMEETGMIVELGRWILETACQDAMSWNKPVTVAVNISAVQFSRSDVLDDIKHALKKSSLPKDRLHIEITESLFISDPDMIVKTLNAIRDEGIKIALDDFGTGYSSLSYIHQFPLDKIKIDRAFIKDLPHSMDSMAVINAVIALARGFDMDIVAEGMEDQPQAEVLRLAGCHIGQGWYFGKPAPSDEFNRRYLGNGGSPDLERVALNGTG